MSIPPEVQAAIVTLAGDWAVKFTNYAKTHRSRKSISDLIKENFEGAYDYLVNTIEARQDS